MEIAHLGGRLAERCELMETAKVTATTTTYAAVTKKMPKIGNKTVTPRDAEKVVLVYPTDESITDSEDTKKMVKGVLVPKEQGITIKAVKKIQKAGLVIESGTRRSAEEIKELTTRGKRLRVAPPKRILPKMLIYDVGHNLKEEEIMEYVYMQNLEEHEISQNLMMDGFKILFKMGRREGPKVNIVVEVDPKIRELLLEAGRVYIDYDACRVVDFLHVSRCFKCQAYGHVRKTCKSTGESLCSHCGRAGHEYAGCPRKWDTPTCVNCLAAKRPCDHRVGTMECPMYKRLVEQRTSMTYYG